MITIPLAASRFLRRAEAAKHIREKWGYPCSPRTLAKYAVVGGGPPFRKAGRYPLYHPEELDRWVSDKLSDPVTSTSELAADSSSRQSIKSRGQGAAVVGTNGLAALSNGLAPGGGHENPMARRGRRRGATIRLTNIPNLQPINEEDSND
jgi:hypothetical protein